MNQGDNKVDANKDGATQDLLCPTITDPDKYKVIFENERVRLVEYRDQPGDKTSPHQHPWDTLVYPLNPLRRRLTFADGRSIVLDKKAGEVHWTDGTTKRWGENVGLTHTHSLLFQLKEPPSAR